MNLDIDGWLRGIGLEQYAQTFRDNAIDADVLRDLTDEHLRELGLPLGARLKLLRAVAALGTKTRLRELASIGFKPVALINCLIPYRFCWPCAGLRVTPKWPATKLTRAIVKAKSSTTTE